MKFSVGKEILLEALQKVQNVIEKKNTVQILSNVLLNCEQQNLTIVATDLEVGINVTIPIENGIDGKIAISGKSLFEIVKELPSKKTITLIKKENNWVEILCQKSTFNIVGLSSEEFPPLPKYDESLQVRFNTTFMREMIDRTIFSVSNDETRYHLNGVFCESIENRLLRMVSTDGHRMALIDKEAMLNGYELFEKGMIIPKKGLTELRRLLDTKTESFSAVLEKNNFIAKIDNCLLFIRLIEAEYPDYELVIPKNNNNRIVLNREMFLSSLKRVSLLANEKSKSVKFSITSGSMTISSSNPDLGDAQEILDIDYSGVAVEIGFNARYIIECLSILDCEKVNFDLSDKLNPGIIFAHQREDYRYIVMPMRI